MPPRRRRNLSIVEDDSLSDELEDVSEDFIRPKRAKSEVKVDQDWIDKYAPKSSAEVSVNPKKLKEMRDYLVPMINGELNCRLLVVTGPSGCAKSTLVKCLGNELVASRKRGSDGIDGFTGQSSKDLENVIEYLDFELENVNQRNHFDEFLDGCRYRVGSNLALIVVEELPNVFHPETLKNFRVCLSNWIYSQGNVPPMVLCLTEVEIESESGHKGYYNIENSLTAETLLGRDLLNHGTSSGLVKRVKFLPIAKTFMKKTLAKIIKIEKINLPESQLEPLLAALYASGDIRALISNLQFWARSPNANLDVARMMRENQITLFHAVGKVIHSSTKYASMDNDFSDYFSIKSVVESYNNLGLLLLALLENYQIYNGLQYDIKEAANLVDALSISDTLETLEEAHEYGIRAVRHQLRTVTESLGRTQSMKFPRHFKMLKAANKVRKEVDSYVRYFGNCRLSFADANLLDGFYVPAIFNSFRYKLKNGSRPYAYNRVGGKFQEIFADEEVSVMENEFEYERGVKDQFLVDIEAKMGQELQSEEEAELSEEIDSTDEEEDFNDSLDSKLISMTQRKDDEDFSDDPELDWLVSQGKL